MKDKLIKVVKMDRKEHGLRPVYAIKHRITIKGIIAVAEKGGIYAVSK